MAYKLRPHQQTAINKARESFLNGNKHICLCACVASGKTLVAKTIIDSAIAKGKKVSFFSFRKILISQLKSYFDEVPNVTIDTLQKMGKNPTEKYDLAIFDEKDFHNTKLKNNITCERSITLSGSPIDASGNALDFDEIIDIIQIPDLIKIGLAKPIKVLSNSLADTSKLKKQAGDFKTKEAYDLMEKPKIKKGLIDTYKKYASDRITILFAVDTNHAESLKTEFLAAGIKCDTTHSKKDEAGRIAFENGEIKLLINVMQLTTGYDFPPINCVMFARPCASIPLFIQCVGRGIRLNPANKNDYCLVIDCAEVLKRTNFHPMQRLDLQKKKQDKTPKCNKCKSPVKLIDRKITIIDKYEYCVTSTYKCTECDNIQQIENIKLFNLEICEGCGNEFESKDGLQLTQSDNSINFDIECVHCNHKKKFREILLSDEELKEVTLKEAMENTETWEQVLLILKAESKRDGYKWQYALRLMETCKNKKMTPREVVEHIKRIRLSGKKLSMLNYI